MSLVRKAIQLMEGEDYDQVWCVFDKDSFPAVNFNEAIALAKRIHIKVAYTNEAFELWYLLHFHFYQTAITRDDYIKKLDNLLGSKYEKNRTDIYDLLESRLDEAIKNAKRLLSLYDPCNPSRDNPSTTVHLLVEELQRFSR